MVHAGRADFFLDARIDLRHALAQTGLDQTLETAPMLELPLYLGFQTSDRGREPRAIGDGRMPQLLQDGTISRLYREWEWGVWPFDDTYR